VRTAPRERSAGLPLKRGRGGSCGVPLSADHRSVDPGSSADLVDSSASVPAGSERRGPCANQGVRWRLDRLGVLLGGVSTGGMLLLLPAGGHPGDSIRLPLAAGVLGAFMLVLVGRTPQRWLSRAMVFALLAFGGSYVISILASFDPERSAMRSSGIPISIVVGLLAMRLGASSAVMRWIGLAAGAALLLMVVDMLWQRIAEFSLIGGLPMSSRQQGSLPNANDVAMAAPLAALATATLDLRRTAGRILSSVLALSTLVVWHLSDSRNLLLGIAAAGATCVLIRGGEFRRRLRWILVVAFLLVPAILPWTSLRHRIIVDRVAATSASTRPAASASSDAPASTEEAALSTLIRRLAATSRGRLYTVAWRTAAASPLLGCGPGLFAEAWWHHEGGVAWGEIAPDVGYMPWAHNLWLEAAAERGLLGLAAFLGLLGTWVAVAVVGWRRRGDEVQAVLPFAAAVSAAAGLMAMGLFDLTFLKEWIGLLLMFGLGASAGAAVGLSAVEAGPARAERSPPTSTTASASAAANTA
jgi:O-antigen ligase